MSENFLLPSLNSTGSANPKQVLPAEEYNSQIDQRLRDLGIDLAGAVTGVPGEVTQMAKDVSSGRPSGNVLANLMTHQLTKLTNKATGFPVANLVMGAIHGKLPEAAASTAIMAGTGAAVGGLPGFIAGSLLDYFAQDSIRDGYLGDWMDRRENEPVLDYLEDEYGLSPSESWETAHQPDLMKGYSIPEQVFEEARRQKAARQQSQPSQEPSDYMKWSKTEGMDTPGGSVHGMNDIAAGLEDYYKSRSEDFGFGPEGGGGGYDSVGDVAEAEDGMGGMT